MDPESDYIMLDVYMVLHELCHVQPPKVGLFISAVEQVKFYLFFFLDFFFFFIFVEPAASRSDNTCKYCFTGHSSIHFCQFLLYLSVNSTGSSF